MPTLVALLLIVIACSMPLQAADYEIVSERPHPNRAFTQGLLIVNDEFIESSGLYRQSFVQRYPVKDNGKPVVRHQPRKDFSEGLAFTGEHFWLLTWQQGIARKLETTSLAAQSIAHYPGEGWGLTFNGQHLIMSDGSDTLQFRDPENFALKRTLSVRLRGEPLTALNELEYADGVLWANVWFDARLFAIDPTSGEVIDTLDLSRLVQREAKAADHVLNDIAWNPADNTLWVTGKRWHKLYQLRLSRWPAVGATAAQ